MPLIHATRAPTQGTALLQVSPQRYLLIWTRTVWCPSWLWYAATCPTRWPRSVGCRDLRLVGVYVFVLFAYFLFDFRSSLCCHLCLVLFACLLLYDWHRRRVVCYISAFRCSKMTHFEDVLEWFAQLKIASVVMSTLRATRFDLVFCQRNQRQ